MSANPGQTPFLSQIRTLLLRDLRLEWRGRSRLVAVVMFGIVTLILFSFAVGPDTEVMREGAGGFLTLALLLSSTLALTESFRIEQIDRGLEGLALLPIDPAALYYAKAISNTIFLTVLGPILLPLVPILYAVDTDLMGILQLWGLWTLAAAGLSAPGTLYAAMTSRLKSQDVLLPLLLFPLVIPVLGAMAKASSLALSVDAMGQLSSWSMLLFLFAVIYWCLGGVLYPYIDDQGL